MTHYRDLDPAVRQRLTARGIDPEQSTVAFIEAVRDGSFPLDRILGNMARLARPRMAKAIPLAVVLPDT